MMRYWTMVLLLCGAAANAQTPGTASAPIAHALADPARADQQGDDARREAAAMLAFSGVKPGQAVIDYLPGKGYWTRIFSGIVGPRGHVYADWPSTAAKYATKALPAIQALGLKNVTAEVQPTSLPTASAPIDLFWTVQNYHDINNGGPFGAGGVAGMTAFNAAVFKLLKHGGTYLVIDHADAPGTGMSGTDTKHRIDPAIAKAQIEAAGFRFVGESPVLRNPADDHAKPVFDPTIRGKTDQFVYRFRKP